MKKGGSINLDRVLGSDLSCLSSEEAKELLKKYHNAIRYRCQKYSFLNTHSVDDLVQECEIKIVSGYHSFMKSKSSEKTWVNNVTKKTLIGICKSCLAQSRAVHLPDEENKLKPVFDYSLDFKTNNADGDETLSIEEVYSGSPDGRVVFGTISENPEENLSVIEMLSVIKNRLSPSEFSFIKRKIAVDKVLDDLLKIEEKIKAKLLKEGFSRIKSSEMSHAEDPNGKFSSEEISILKKVKRILMENLGFPKDVFYEFDSISCNLSSMDEIEDYTNWKKSRGRK